MVNISLLNMDVSQLQFVYNKTIIVFTLSVFILKGLFNCQLNFKTLHFLCISKMLFDVYFRN